MNLEKLVVTIFFMAGILAIPIELVMTKLEEKHKPSREELLQELKRMLKEYEESAEPR